MTTARQINLSPSFWYDRWVEYKHLQVEPDYGNQRGGYWLTPRQIETVRYVAKGMTSKQIGEVMGISRKTVEVVLMNIRQRMGVAKTRTAVRILVEEGVIK